MTFSAGCDAWLQVTGILDHQVQVEEHSVSQSHWAYVPTAQHHQELWPGPEAAFRYPGNSRGGNEKGSGVGMGASKCMEEK